jgi:hypothetical protein
VWENCFYKVLKKKTEIRGAKNWEGGRGENNVTKEN